MRGHASDTFTPPNGSPSEHAGTDVQHEMSRMFGDDGTPSDVTAPLHRFGRLDLVVQAQPAVAVAQEEVQLVLGSVYSVAARAAGLLQAAPESQSATLTLEDEMSSLDNYVQH